MDRSTHSSSIFLERLRAAREMRELSQSELAKRSGMQASAISHFETGARKPSFDNLRRLADALDVTTDYLLGRVSDTNALAGGEKLFRHLEQLSSDDQDIAEEILQLLAKKAAERKSEK
ncbi:MAG: helix-turn-helix transcriptional regulator [Acidimicrobiia bacterium]|nr:helix-turn-helix transcriptional regulator [Gammaproteobacteria bacterium]MYI21090.1 helix-turn-helix transcriptional regulator [Acidimicrobiia bacterium]